MLLGRKSHELVGELESPPWSPETRVYLFSRTLRPEYHPDVTVVNDGAADVVAGLRAEPGDGEIWLFGGGTLFRSLLAAGQVDRIEVTVVPVLLGDGVPLLPLGTLRTTLELTDTRTYPSGMVTLTYRVPGVCG